MKFTPGPAIASASGSIGGTTFSHNRFGAYTRKRSIPTDPNTNRQQAVKGNMSYLSSIWNLTLTQAQRDSWTEYGANVPRIDSLGQTHYLTGLQWFVGTNTIALQAGLSVIVDAPTTFNRGEQPALVNIVPSDPETPPDAGDSSYLNFNAGSPTLNLQMPEPLPSGTLLMISMGRPINPTINFYRAPWRFWQSWDASLDTQHVIPVPLSNPLPFVYTLGQSLFVRLRTFYPDGRYSPAQDFKLTALDITGG